MKVLFEALRLSRDQTSRESLGLFTEMSAAKDELAAVFCEAKGWASGRYPTKTDAGWAAGKVNDMGFSQLPNHDRLVVVVRIADASLWDLFCVQAFIDRVWATEVTEEEERVQR